MTESAPSIRTRRRGGRLSLEVENPCDNGGAGWVEGIGLANVRQRLATGFGRDAGLAVDAADGRFRVSVTLPAQATAQAGGAGA